MKTPKYAPHDPEMLKWALEEPLLKYEGTYENHKRFIRSFP